jgi:hypothetical protein
MSGLHHEFSRFIEKDLSRPGQRDPPLIAQKKGNAQIFLKLADLTT